MVIIKHTVAVVIYSETLSIWGVFSTRKKAEKAIGAWGAKWAGDFTIRMYAVDFRSPRDATKYASDSLPSVAMGLTVTTGSGELPDTSDTRTSGV